MEYYNNKPIQEMLKNEKITTLQDRFINETPSKVKMKLKEQEKKEKREDKEAVEREKYRKATEAYKKHMPQQGRERG